MLKSDKKYFLRREQIENDCFFRSEIGTRVEIGTIY